jgi:hypothetical protein
MTGINWDMAKQQAKSIEHWNKESKEVEEIEEV